MMMGHTRPYFFIFLFVLIVCIALLHGAGTAFSWYWRFSFFDIAIHTLSGAWIAGMVLWFYYCSSYMKPRYFSRGFMFALPILFTLVVGIFWEIFELGIGATFIDYERYLSDTVFDFISNITGAFVLSFYFIYTHTHKTIYE